MTTSQRPALGDLKPGDPVIVRYHAAYQQWQTIDATVIKAARVWITVAGDGREWRMRRDTQRTDNGTNYNHRFATPEQHAWDQRIADADSYLREQGIEIRHVSDWYPAHRRIQLADLIRAAEENQ